LTVCEPAVDGRILKQCIFWFAEQHHSESIFGNLICKLLDDDDGPCVSSRRYFEPPPRSAKVVRPSRRDPVFDHHDGERARSYRKNYALIDTRRALLNAAFPTAALRWRAPAYTSVRGVLQGPRRELERVFRRH
jgi:hypothetical protein